MGRRLLVVLLTWSTLLVGTSRAIDLPGLVVVAHAEVAVEQVSARELRRIYLGKATRWPGGQTIRPVMLQQPEAYEQFVETALDRTEENFSVFWKRMVFTGKGRPPRTFDTAGELAFYVRETAGAIGFLPVGADRTGLKVIVLD